MRSRGRVPAVPILVVVAALHGGCTLGASARDPVIVRPAPDPDRMPPAVLARQDPSADTSKNPVLSRTTAHHVESDGARALGCMQLLSCNSRGRTDASAGLIVLAAIAATRRRRSGRETS